MSAAMHEARQSRWYGAVITAGLIAYGAVHLLIAWVALQLAWEDRRRRRNKAP